MIDILLHACTIKDQNSGVAMAITLDKNQYNQLINTVAYQPGYVMWKHKDLSYVAINDYSAKLLGFSSADQFVGLTDHDIKLKMDRLDAFAEFLRARSTAIFENNQDTQFIQFIPFESEYQMMYGSDTLIRNKEGDAITSILSAQKISPHTVLSIGMLLHPLLKEKIKKKEAVIMNLVDQYPHLKLGKRQSQCLYHLIAGLSMKAIAKKMLISMRTVESHIERIKYLLNCTTKIELIEKAIDLDLINYIVLD